MSDKHPEIECYECGRLKTRLIWNSRCATCVVRRLEANLEENDNLRGQLAALEEEVERLKAGEASVRDALDGYDNHAEPAHEIVKSIRHRHDSYVDTICDLKARMAVLAAPDVQEPAAWKEPAANWLRKKAAAQQALNEQYPEHAKRYPAWESWVVNLNWVADELSVGVAPKPTEQQPDVTQLVEALEAMVDRYAPSYHDCTDDGTPSCEICDARAALAAYRKTDIKKGLRFGS